MSDGSPPRSSIPERCSPPSITTFVPSSHSNIAICFLQHKATTLTTPSSSKPSCPDSADIIVAEIAAPALLPGSLYVHFTLRQLQCDDAAPRLSSNEAVSKRTVAFHLPCHCGCLVHTSLTLFDVLLIMIVLPAAKSCTSRQKEWINRA